MTRRAWWHFGIVAVGWAALYAAALLLAGLLGGCAHIERAKAEIGWESPTAAEAAVLAVAAGATVVDVLQTADLKNHPELEETNPLARPCLVCAGLAGLAGEAALWYVLPPPWRSVWAAGVGGYEIAVDAHHVRLGLALRFP